MHDMVADNIYNRVRTARMRLNLAIPPTIFVAGKLLRIWYPSQPKMYRDREREPTRARDHHRDYSREGERDRSSRCHHHHRDHETLGDESDYDFIKVRPKRQSRR